MSHFLSSLHEFARLWYHTMVKCSLYITLVIAATFVLLWFLRKASPRWTSWCWRLAYLKLAILTLGIPSVGIPILRPIEHTKKEKAQTSINNKQKQAPRQKQAKASIDITKTHTQPTSLLKTNASVSKKPRESLPKTLSNSVKGIPIASVSSNQWHLLTWLFVLWSLGVLYLITAVYLQWRNLRTIRKNATPLEDKEAIEAYRLLHVQLQLKSPPKVLIGKDIKSPLITGILKPAIILPEQVLETCCPQELQLIFAHELVHFVRKDLSWQWLPGIMHMFFFFHPVVFWGNRSWLLHQEMCADEEALHMTRDSAESYGKLLLGFAQLQSRAGRVFATFGAFRSFRMLRRRITAMKHYQDIPQQRKLVISFFIGLIAAIGILPWHLEAAKKPFVGQKQMTPHGWSILGSYHQDYEVGIDKKTFYDGQASAYIKLKAKAAKKKKRRFLGLRQSFRATQYQGKRIRLTGYLKTSHQNSRGFITLRVNDNDQRLTFGNTEMTVLQPGSSPHRISAGKRDWKKHEIILDVPAKTNNMTLTCFSWYGKGTLWCDAFKIQVVNKKTPITNGWFLGLTGKNQKPQAQNFSTKLSHSNALSVWWLSGRNRGAFDIGVKDKQGPKGGPSAYIKARDRYLKGNGLLMQAFSAKAYRGKRIQLSAQLKNSTKGKAGIWLHVKNNMGRVIFNKLSKPIPKGSWKKVNLLADIPKEAKSIYIGCSLRGQGPLWCARFQLQIKGKARQRSLKTRLTNLTFAQAIKTSFDGSRPFGRWLLGGRRPNQYEIGQDTSTFYDTKSSGYIRSKTRYQTGHGALFQTIHAQQYKGKRIQLTALIKSKSKAFTFAELFALSRDRYGQTVSYRRARLKSHDKWTKIEIVHQIPQHSKTLGVGVLYQGKGTLWLDNVQVRIVKANQPLHGKGWSKAPLASTPQNLDFSKGTHQTKYGPRPRHWEKWGSNPRAYQIGLSKKVHRKGGASGILSIKQGRPARGFAQILQFISAQKYKGKRVRLTGYIKVKQANWFKLAMGSTLGRKTLNYARIAPKGTPDSKGWYKIQIIQDVPANASTLSFGCALQGKGPIWCDDFSLEVVQTKQAVTKSHWKKALQKAKSNPGKNLRFEQK